ncbi:MAG: N-acetylmuramoyl-L-alanine amidase [Bacteroidota bacterium]
MLQIPNFDIKNHRLIQENGKPVTYRASPNRGSKLTPQYLVMHYTAGRDAASSISWLTNPASRASAHLVIGRDGEITQLVPFNRKAWHAGRSEWNGLVGLNHHAIGIELDNAGRLTRRASGWYTWFGHLYPEGEVVEATHKNEDEPAGWHTFPEVQLLTAIGAASAIMQHYELLDVVGHDDVSPIRKSDPGPAFPMTSFRSRVIGRNEEDELKFVTTGNLNIRYGPGVSFDTLPGSPLPEGTQVLVLHSNSGWQYVEVLEELEHEGCGLRGWVSGRFLERVS